MLTRGDSSHHVTLVPVETSVVPIDKVTLQEAVLVGVEGD